MTIDELTFPVLTIQSGIMSVELTGTELTTCSPRALRTGFYKNLTIIDSTGIRVRGKSASKIGYAGPFWGFSLLKERGLRVEIELSPQTHTVTLSEAKEEIMKGFRKDRLSWEACGSLEELDEMVKKSNSFKELFELRFWRG